jgi:DNA-binding FrmR family transcriptional regulator
MKLSNGSSYLLFNNNMPVWGIIQGWTRKQRKAASAVSPASKDRCGECITCSKRSATAWSGALESLKQIILREHMQQCVTDAFHNGSLRERREKINELIRLFDGHYR